MASYPIVVAQHRIEGHPRRTEHWNLVVMTSGDSARTFELVGNTDTFAYYNTVVDRFSQSQMLRGGCQVGEIPPHRLGWLASKLKEVQVIRNNLDFDCQTWIMNCIWLLKETGIIYSCVNERFIREELKKENERWETAEDTVFERLQ